MELEKYAASEIPYDQFELLGYSKKDVLDIKKDVLDNFLSGGKTDLRLFSIPVDGQTFRVEGKLSLQRQPDNSVSLNIHPAQKEIQNNLGLDNEELEALKNGRIFSKTINGERNLLQLDRETNEILTAKTKGLSIPFDLTSAERERLLNGKSLELEIDGKTRNFRLDLVDPNGFRLDKTEAPSRYVGTNFLSTEIKDADINKYRLNEYDIADLLDGKRTELKEVDGNSIKLSLQRNPDNSVSLNIHPVQREIQNNFGLTSQELDRLKAGEILVKNSADVSLNVDKTNEISLNSEDKGLLEEIAKNGNSAAYVHFQYDEDQVLAFVEKVGIYNEFIDADMSERMTDKNHFKDMYSYKYDDDLELSKAYENNLTKAEEYELTLKNAAQMRLDLDMDKTLQKSNDKTLYQLDRETNEILKQKEKNVIPSAIRDIQLSSDQQERLRQGASVTLNKNGESITAKVDLGSSGGLQIKDDRNTLHYIYKNNLSDTKEIEKRFSNKADMNKFMERNNLSSKNMPGSARAAFDKQQAISFDRHNPGVVSHIRTDANRAEYMDMGKKNTSTLKR